MASVSQVLAQPKFQNILLTTDFSSCSEAAVPYARAIAERYGSTVHVVHAVPPEPVVVGESGIEFPDLPVERHNEVTDREHMDRFLRSGALSHVRCTQTVRTGVVWEVVSELVTSLHIDLIITATHGRRGLQHFVLGSIAEQIFRRANCPVLTVGPGAQDGMAAGKLHTIVYATDFSPASVHALDYALSLARTNQATLLLMHAMNASEVTIGFLKQAIGQAKQRLSELIPVDSGVTYQVVVACMSAPDMILKAARDVSVDLIVMGAHHGGSASAHTPWAVAHQVVCNAPCPVLTVRS